MSKGSRTLLPGPSDSKGQVPSCKLRSILVHSHRQVYRIQEAWITWEATHRGTLFSAYHDCSPRPVLCTQNKIVSLLLKNKGGEFHFLSSTFQAIKILIGEFKLFRRCLCKEHALDCCNLTFGLISFNNPLTGFC